MFIFGLVVVCFALQFGVRLDSIFVLGKHGRLYDQYDPLAVARCEARCWNVKSKNKCTKVCLTKEVHPKPGLCPVPESTGAPSGSPFEAACLNACREDSQCPGTTKCCAHRCGITCQLPKDLRLQKDIPDIPENLTVTERKKRRIMQVTWSSCSEGSASSPIVYVVEARNHFGQNFIENRMSDWFVCAKTFKPLALLKRFGKPGRWYQFRVSAVNSNGTKGYSKPSRGFSTSTDPRPPKTPQNMSVGSLFYFNGSVSTELNWKSPKSDLPIDKYKVFWSKRLHGASALDSVLVHQQVVSKERTRFLLKDLQPNSLYFLQVQAFSQFGSNKLKGDKSGMLLNTSNYTILDKAIDKNYSQPVEGLALQKIVWLNGQLRARVTWKFKFNIKRFIISWWSTSCNPQEAKGQNIIISATTKSTQFDLYNLDFNCRYRVAIKEVNSEDVISSQDAALSFTVPSCNYFQKHYVQVPC